MSRFASTHRGAVLSLACGLFALAAASASAELSPSASWTSAESDDTLSLDWGDYDGDGDLDLAVANYDQPNRVYANDGSGVLTASWISAVTSSARRGSG